MIPGSLFMMSILYGAEPLNPRTMGLCSPHAGHHRWERRDPGDLSRDMFVGVEMDEGFNNNEAWSPLHSRKELVLKR